jgi:hypothetical protein
MISLTGSVCLAGDPINAKDCMTAETKDSYTLLTNKCGQTVNVFWKDASDACKTAGCSRKMPPKAYYYVDLFKEPYILGACYAPQEVDPQWNGVGVATCKAQQ